MTKKFDFLNSIKVIVSPWDKGFTCGILLDSRNKMTDEQYELCSTIARGMIKQATTDPHSTFLAGMRGFAEDRKYQKTNGGNVDEKAKLDDTENIIDFLKYLQRKRNKELN
jgi:hypothetical protein